MVLHTAKGLRVAVEGCGHGTLHNIYASIAKSCEAKSWNGVDLLIIGGDFQVSQLYRKPRQCSGG